MGSGYWILVWDGWGNGLDMINPRFIQDGRNFSTGGERWPDERIAGFHSLHEYEHWRVIRSESYLEDAAEESVEQRLFEMQGLGSDKAETLE